MSTIAALPAELTIYSVSELYPRCLEWTSSAAEAACLDLAADAVSEVDAAGVQLLMALQNTLHRQQRQLRLLNPSAALGHACRALGAPLMTSTQESRP